MWGEAAELSSPVRMILPLVAKNHALGGGSGDQAGFLAELHGLCAPPGAQLVKQAARVRLYGIFADKDALRDLASAEPGGDEAAGATCWTTTCVFFLVRVRPSQMPRAANSAAIRPP